MCFLMGAAVGGMLPIAFALLAETIPARHRGWLMVLIGGDVAGAYILTSFLASVLEPRFSWRILWLIGLPTGVLLILLNRWIPESPRFLLATGRIDQARAVMARFGAKLVPDPTPTPANAPEQTTTRLRQLWRPPYRGLTGALALFALAWGLVNNGFLLWLPTNLRQLGLPVASADQLLAASALIGFPAVFLVAWLYGFWSSKATMIIAATAVAAALTTFAVLGSSIAHDGLLLQAMIVLLLAGTGAMLAMLTPYSSEVFPTQIRARGTGLAGACARAGGFLGVGAVLLTITPASLTGAALLGAIPTILAIAALWFYGVETRRRSLEEINADRQAKVASVSITPSRSSPARNQ
jgi:putative MFS transporter